MQAERVKAIYDYRTWRTLPGNQAKELATKKRSQIPPRQIWHDFVVGPHELPAAISDEIHAINKEVRKSQFKTGAKRAVAYATTLGGIYLMSGSLLQKAGVNVGMPKLLTGLPNAAVAATAGVIIFIIGAALYTHPKWSHSLKVKRAANTDSSWEGHLSKRCLQRLEIVREWIKSQKNQNVIGEKSKLYNAVLLEPKDQLIFTNFSRSFLRDLLVEEDLALKVKQG
jgi:hypothetical protein